MNNSLSKKIILRLLDCDPKSVSDIASDIGESLAVTEKSLSDLVSGNICETVSQDDACRWVIKNDIDTFARLVNAFLSSAQKPYEEVSRFITSQHYFSRIDDCLVNYVLQRFHLDAVYQTNEDKEVLRRILLASPSALIFALHGDTTKFRELHASWNQLDSSDSTQQWFAQILYSEFHTPLLEMLVADMKVLDYGILYATLQLHVAKVSIHVSLATPAQKYVEAIGGGSFSLGRIMEALRAGQLVSVDDPMHFCNQGLALIHLGDLQTALKDFDKALNVVQDSIDKAIVLNNKGLAFLRFRQYQNAIECFNAAIDFDSEGKIPPIRENKQLATEYLNRATDADNLTEPTQIRFVQDQPVPFEETRLYEFKEVSGGNPVSSITNTADEYAVAFLNGKGGRIFWGIRDSDRITVGVFLDEQQKDEIRIQVSQKLWSIRPPIVDGDWHFEFHNCYDIQGQTIENLWVIELVIAPVREKNVFYTNSGDLFVKTEGGKQKLLGPQVTQFIRNFFENNAETD